ncbi:hypothetical protein [Sediminitomix flava]|uniref:Autotransporter adhesin-like protein n=1 Tax=Sediminitomix flava TaxID=379075 RepID=A0A315YWM7_SEDFL|nr:hypothetical protein [Sediminitomix flava]PWJ34170.1 hypothetical protein BC781_11180 [Sediminitomix flava]
MKKGLIAISLLCLISFSIVGQNRIAPKVEDAGKDTSEEVLTIKNAKTLDTSGTFKTLIIQKGTLNIPSGVILTVREKIVMCTNALLNLDEGASIRVLSEGKESVVLEGNSTIKNEGKIEINGSIILKDFSFYRGRGVLEVKKDFRTESLAEVNIEGEAFFNNLLLNNESNHKFSISEKAKLEVKSKIELTHYSSLEISGLLDGKGSLDVSGKSKIHVIESGHLALAKSASFSKNSIGEIVGKFEVGESLDLFGHSNFIVYGEMKVKQHIHHKQKAVVDISKHGKFMVGDNYYLNDHGEVYVDGEMMVWGSFVSTSKLAKNIFTSAKGVIKVSTQNTLKLDGVNISVEESPTVL